MIVHHEVNEIQRSGIVGERKFGISMNAKMYDMMSSKLYQDRIGSVTREVCSNAWDGMKMKSMATGSPIEPFKITLPTNMEPHFVVEDFGVGMPDEQAQDLYSTLGLSTKENSNHQIGAFGLGSKSPFAVTDTFTVENTYEGVTYHYLCFKNESGLPSLLKTGQGVEEGRVNGVKVIIPAPYLKFDEYVKAVNKQLFAMEPKPIVTNGRGFQFATPNKLAECPQGYILSNPSDFNLYSNNIYGKMGMVIYPIDINSSGINSYGIHRNIKGSIILTFDIGDLDPLPSREGLTYDKRTIANITKNYNEFVEIYKETLKAEVLEIKLPLVGYKRVNELHSNYGLDIRNDVEINGFGLTNKTFKNYFPTFKRTFEHVTPEVVRPEYVRYDGTVVAEVRTPEVRKNVTVVEDEFVYTEYGRSEQRLNVQKELHKMNDVMTYEYLEKVLNGNITIMLYDEEEPKYRIGRLKSVLNSHCSWYNEVHFMYVNSKSPESKTDFTNLIAKFEAVHPGITDKFIYLSKVPKPEVTKTTFVKDSTTSIDGLKLVKPMRSYRYESSICLDDMEKLVNNTIDLNAHDAPFEGKALYINCTRNDVDNYDKDLSTFKSFCEYQGIYLFIVRKGGKGQVQWLEDNGVLEFSAYMDDKLKNVVVTEDFKKIASARRIKSNNACRSFSSYGNNYTIFEYLYSELKKDNEYIHPAIFTFNEITRLAAEEDVKLDDNTKLLVNLKDRGMMSLFIDKYEWAGNLDVDMLEGWDEQREDLFKVYPALNAIKNSMSEYNNDEARFESPASLKYIKDYNKILGLTKDQEVNDYVLLTIKPFTNLDFMNQI